MLRPYQIDLAKKGYRILQEKGILYLACEMRVGKTLIALTIANFLRVNGVLFVTKKKAIGSIEKDYQRFKFNYWLKVVNYEQVGKLSNIFDLIIIDEAHSLGAFPKPSLRTINIKRITGDKPLILLSGTPTPESYSQIFHQLWISGNSPFNNHKNFYSWAREYVVKKERVFNGLRVNDYSNAKQDKIEKVIKPYIISFTQKQAGFEEKIIEEIKEVPVHYETAKIIKTLIDKRYYRFDDGSEIICDTAVKLLSKVHQLFAGTVKTENGDIKIVNELKADYILDNYRDKKIAVFYKFIAEGEVLKKRLGKYTLDPNSFNLSNVWAFISQFQSGSMGINLSAADVIIFYNIDFSSVLYWQSRARLLEQKRTKPALCHWLFTREGIEQKIYKTVLKKKDYTTYYFKKDFRC